MNSVLTKKLSFDPDAPKQCQWVSQPSEVSLVSTVYSEEQMPVSSAPVRIEVGYPGINKEDGRTCNGVSVVYRSRCEPTNIEASAQSIPLCFKATECGVAVLCTGVYSNGVTSRLPFGTGNLFRQPVTTLLTVPLQYIDSIEMQPGSLSFVFASREPPPNTGYTVVGGGPWPADTWVLWRPENDYFWPWWTGVSPPPPEEFSQKRIIEIYDYYGISRDDHQLVVVEYRLPVQFPPQTDPPAVPPYLETPYYHIQLTVTGSPAPPAGVFVTGHAVSVANVEVWRNFDVNTIGDAVDKRQPPACSIDNCDTLMGWAFERPRSDTIFRDAPPATH